MTLTLGPQSTVTKPKAANDQPVAVLDADGFATAPFAGPAVFHVPIVLPKTAAVRACRIKAEADAPAVLNIGATSKKIAAGKRTELTLDADAFAHAGEFEIDELPFNDFLQFELNVTVDAPAKAHAKLSLTAELDYRLPVESAAAYLNYIMTQA